MDQKFEMIDERFDRSYRRMNVLASDVTNFGVVFDSFKVSSA